MSDSIWHPVCIANRKAITDVIAERYAKAETQKKIDSMKPKKEKK